MASKNARRRTELARPDTRPRPDPIMGRGASDLTSVSQSAVGLKRDHAAAALTARKAGTHRGVSKREKCAPGQSRGRPSC